MKVAQTAVLSAVLSAVVATAEPLKILFVGNSYTYGPPPYDYEDRWSYNHLPRLLKLIAQSKGKEVLWEEDTMGSCTLQLHRPSKNPEYCRDPAVCKLVNLTRMPASEGCTMDAALTYKASAPCPQTLVRQPHGLWDVVVLQEHSTLPPIQEAREKMFYPVFEEFAEILHEQLGKHLPDRKMPKLASYMTWSYYKGDAPWNLTTGERSKCPGLAPVKEVCWPNGFPDEMSGCNSPNSTFYQKVWDQECNAYATARAYADTTKHGADIIVPAGLAWQMARGSPEIPEQCKALIDDEYPDAGPLGALSLPLRPKDASDARWIKDLDAQRLYRDMGPNGTKEEWYCNDGCTIDSKHPSMVAMYLNALVFYATLFKDDPVGATWPDGSEVDGMKLQAIDEEEAKVMQRLARDTVMPYLDVWWGTDTASDSIV